MTFKRNCTQYAFCLQRFLLQIMRYDDAKCDGPIKCVPQNNLFATIPTNEITDDKMGKHCL